MVAAHRNPHHLVVRARPVLGDVQVTCLGVEDDALRVPVAVRVDTRPERISRSPRSVQREPQDLARQRAEVLSRRPVSGVPHGHVQESVRADDEPRPVVVATPGNPIDESLPSGEASPLVAHADQTILDTVPGGIRVR